MNVRRKSFLIGMFLIPAFIAGMAILPALLAKKGMQGEGETRKVAIIVLTGQLHPEVKKVLEQQGSRAKYTAEEVVVTTEGLEKSERSSTRESRKGSSTHTLLSARRWSLRISSTRILPSTRFDGIAGM